MHEHHIDVPVNTKSIRFSDGFLKSVRVFLLQLFHLLNNGKNSLLEPGHKGYDIIQFNLHSTVKITAGKAADLIWCSMQITDVPVFTHTSHYGGFIAQKQIKTLQKAESYYHVCNPKSENGQRTSTPLERICSFLNGP